MEDLVFQAASGSVGGLSDRGDRGEALRRSGITEAACGAFLGSAVPDKLFVQRPTQSLKPRARVNFLFSPGRAREVIEGHRCLCFAVWRGYAGALSAKRVHRL